jgi:hypothetical protein
VDELLVERIPIRPYVALLMRCHRLGLVRYTFGDD